MQWKLCCAYLLETQYSFWASASDYWEVWYILRLRSVACSQSLFKVERTKIMGRLEKWKTWKLYLKTILEYCKSKVTVMFLLAQNSGVIVFIRSTSRPSLLKRLRSQNSWWDSVFSVVYHKAACTEVLVKQELWFSSKFHHYYYFFLPEKQI